MNTKKKIRKSISWLVVLTIFLSAFPQTVFATENKLESEVNVFVQVGQGEQQKIAIPGGKITDHLDYVESLIPKAKKSAFEKVVAVVLEQAGVTTEVEISAVEKTPDNDVIYYALDDYDGSSGIVLEANQKIVLYYETTYTLEYICEGIDGGGGNVGQSPKTITAGEDLHISLLPDDNCFPVSAKMVRKDTSSVDYSSKISGNQLVIPAADITQDATISVTFKKYNSYQVTAGNIANGIFCIDCIKNASDSHASSDNNYQGVTVDSSANSAVVETGKSVLIPLYSNRTNSSGSQSWELNRLKINNEDVKVPANLDVDVPYETTLSNGTKVKVIYKGAERCNTGSCQHDAGRNRTRNIYYIYINNVKTNNSIEVNFKDTSRQEIIFKGLDGIESTGNALETRNFQASPSGYHYYYTLYEDFTNNVYMYNDTAAVHVNMYVYKVKPGYNPYTVNVQGVNTGKMNGEDDITKPGGSTVNLGYTIEEMAALAKSGSQFRHLDGTTGTNLNWRNLGGRDNAFVPKSLSSGYEFGFFLSDPEGKISNNQMVYLNASKYDYAVAYDINGGSGDIEDSNRYQIGQQFNIASSSPTRSGYIFQGWQLVDGSGNAVNDTVYKRNQAFDVNATTVKYTYGDKTENNGLGFTFKAVWKQMSENADLNEYTIYYYREVKTNEVGSIEKDGKYYVEYYEKGSFLGLIGAEIIAINDHTLDASTINWDRYVFNDTLSRLYISELKGIEETSWQEHNKLYYFFDLIEIGSLTIENQVTGTYANVNKAFEYTVTINDPTAGDSEFDIAGDSSGNPTSIKNNVATTLYLKNDEHIFIDGLSKEATYTIEENNDGYKVSISLTYSVAQGSIVTNDENSITGSMSLEEEIQDVSIVFMNHLDYEETPTGIQLNGFPYTISLIILSSTFILFVRNKRKEQV